MPYFVHNLVVFDNIVSFIFFAALLAIIHTKVATDRASWLESMNVPTKLVNQVILPVVLVVMIFLIYSLNWAGYKTAGSIIEVYRSPLASDKLRILNESFNRSPFMQQELAEQMSRQLPAIFGNPNIPHEDRAEFVGEIERRFADLVAHKPGDTRIHTFLSSFYRQINNLEKSSS